MSKQYSHILAAVASEVWAMEPTRLRAMIGFLELKAAGLHPEIDVVARIHNDAVAAAARTQRVSQSSSGAVTVIPVFGTIMQRGSLMGDISGPRGTSVEQITQQFRAALNDPGVSAIVMDFDTPGGTVSGVPELADEIKAGTKQKQIIGVSDGLCASAGYFLAASCSEVVVSPSSLTGSIGVYTVHEDLSKAMEMQGVSAEFIHYGKHKVDGNSLGPLSDDARADMQARVDYYGAMFEKAVAKGRGMTVADVQSKLGQGKVFNATKAKSSGMADSIGTLDDVLARFGVSRQPSGSQARVGMVSQETVAVIGERGPEIFVATSGRVIAREDSVAKQVAEAAEESAAEARLWAHARREREMQLLSL